ncbi:family 43 glycosylhydrolase [Streptomyces radiopugnans]|nr:family 43 glycosylhydrolase [Streptomyces radiopugnans]
MATRWPRARGGSSPVPSSSATTRLSVYGPGHNFFFPSPDGKEVWMAYHANSSPSEGCSGTRTTRVQKVNWKADGTPDFGTPVSTSTVLREPSGTP